MQLNLLQPKDSSSLPLHMQHPPDGSFTVYVLVCGPGGSHYTGMTGEFEARMYAHAHGRGGHYTSKHRPTGLLFILRNIPSYFEAIRLERFVKRIGAKRRIKMALESNIHEYVPPAPAYVHFVAGGSTRKTLGLAFSPEVPEAELARIIKVFSEVKCPWDPHSGWVVGPRTSIEKGLARLRRRGIVFNVVQPPKLDFTREREAYAHVR